MSDKAHTALIDRALAGPFTPKEMADIAQREGRPRRFAERVFHKWHRDGLAVFNTDASNRTHWWLTQAGRSSLSPTQKKEG